MIYVCRSGRMCADVGGGVAQVAGVAGGTEDRGRFSGFSRAPRGEASRLTYGKHCILTGPSSPPLRSHVLVGCSTYNE